MVNFLSNEKKFKKYHKNYYKTFKRYRQLTQGYIGIKIMKFFQFRLEHLKLIIKLIKNPLKKINKNVKIYIYIYPDFWITKKPKDVRMGRGKGIYWKKVYNAKAGAVIMEIKSIKNANSIEILNLLKKKFSKLISFEYKKLNTNLLTIKQY